MVPSTCLHPRLGQPHCFPVFTWRAGAPPDVTPLSSVRRALWLWLCPSQLGGSVPSKHSHCCSAPRCLSSFSLCPQGSASGAQCPSPIPSPLQNLGSIIKAQKYLSDVINHIESAKKLKRHHKGASIQKRFQKWIKLLNKQRQSNGGF